MKTSNAREPRQRQVNAEIGGGTDAETGVTPVPARSSEVGNAFLAPVFLRRPVRYPQSLSLFAGHVEPPHSV